MQSFKINVHEGKAKLAFVDEGIDRCSTCPATEGGHSPRTFEAWKQLMKKLGISLKAWSQNNPSSTFSCKHKVTKMPICATPCNGIKEMCEDDADEQCQGTGLIIVLSVTFMLSILFISGALLMNKFNFTKPAISLQEEIAMTQIVNSNGNSISIFLKKRVFVTPFIIIVRIISNTFIGQKQFS